MGLTLKGTRRRAWYRIKSLGGFKVASLSSVHLQRLHQTAIVSNCQRNIKMSTSEEKILSASAVESKRSVTPSTQHHV